jgi:hypothetical protein
MELTQFKDNEYLARFPSGHYEQYRLYGKQTSVNARIYNIRRLRDNQSFGASCREKAEFSKEFSRSQAIKCIVLFLMTDPPVYRNKTSLIKALKQFADSHKIKVSEKKLAEQFSSISGLVK